MIIKMKKNLMSFVKSILIYVICYKNKRLNMKNIWKNKNNSLRCLKRIKYKKLKTKKELCKDN